MGAIAHQTEWKVEASAGKRSQAELSLLGEVSAFQTLPPSLLSKTTFNGCLVEAARHSGLEDQEIAEAMHISAGYMSRFMRGVADHWARRMVVFMRTTRSLAPLQKMADAMGCDLVVRSQSDARIRELEDELLRLKRGA
jgi:transcriptional regulator with XRE-family HTH domain